MSDQSVPSLALGTPVDGDSVVGVQGGQMKRFPVQLMLLHPHVGPTAPVAPVPGKQWTCTTNGKTYTWFGEGPTYQWVESAGFYYADDPVSVAAAVAARDVTVAARDVTTAARDVTVAARDVTIAARDAAIQAQNAGVIGRPDLATLNADLAHADGVVALVTNDPTPANNTNYRKSGASGAGAWVKMSAGDIALLTARVGGFTELFTSANLFSDTEYAKLIALAAGSTLTDSTGVYTKGANSVLASIRTPNGRPAFTFVTSVNAVTTSVTWSIPIADVGIAAGDHASMSLRLLSGTVLSGAAASNNRIMLRQLDAAGAEIVAARQLYQSNAGVLAADTIVSFSGVTVDALCVRLQVYWETSQTASLFRVSEVMLAKGYVTDFRPSPLAYVDARTAAAIAAQKTAGDLASALNITEALSPLFVRPNLISNDWPSVVALGTGAQARTAITSGGRPAVRVEVSAGGEWSFRYGRALFPSGNFAVGCRVLARDRPTGGRVLVMQYDSASVEIAGTRVTLTGANGIAMPFSLSHTAALHADCASVGLVISGNNGDPGQTVTYQDVYLADGQERVFRPAPLSVREAFVSPTGNDVSGKGTVTAPYATFDRAITALDGNGTVWALDGEYGPQLITPTAIKGRVDLLGVRSNLLGSQFAWPIVRCSDKLTGITKTAGRAKVYQVAIGDLPALADFNWIYQDGVNDPRTLIADADRRPQHRGRTHRLSGFAKIPKTTAVTLAAALAEMDAEPLPLSFVDAGILYFTIVGGGDGTVANIYRDSALGLINAGTRGACGTLNIVGLEVRYGKVDLRPFKSSHLDEFAAHGARNAGSVEYNVLTFGTLETSCGGSEAGGSGDGLNGHFGSRVSGLDLYTHDNNDDGFSDHEGGTSRLFGGLTEYNGGGGLTPAYGSDHISYNFVGRRNQQKPGRKPGSFCCVGAATDGGIDTLALFVGCEDIESDTSFCDDHVGGVRAVCVNCKSTRPVTRGFDVYKIKDCSYLASGTSTARNASTLVENSTLVT